MLVLSRRIGEGIVFPETDVNVTLLDVKGNTAKFGVSAPRHVTVLRQELVEQADNLAKPAQPADDSSRQDRHEFQNRLNAVSLGLHVYRRQTQAGQTAAADETFAVLNRELQSLNRNCSNGSGSENGGQSSSPCRTLVVEDDSNERELLAGFLRLMGCEVKTLGDGAEALEYLSSHPRPDVLLLDMRLPRCNGAQIVETIRRNPAYDGLKVYAVTASSQQDWNIDMGPRGIDGWFQKPLNPEVLVREMTRVPERGTA